MRSQTGPVLIAIGANLPGQDGRPARANCIAAAESLRALPGLRFAGLSHWYETDPIPPGGPTYVNGIAWLEADPGQAIDPAWLLERLQSIESRAARVRTVPNAPRTLDLDIIAMGNLVRASPDPILPHPRAHQRRFVLEPLMELLPLWVHSGLGQTVQALVAGLPSQGVRRL